MGSWSGGHNCGRTQPLEGNKQRYTVVNQTSDNCTRCHVLRSTGSYLNHKKTVYKLYKMSKIGFSTKRHKLLKSVHFPVNQYWIFIFLKKKTKSVEPIYVIVSSKCFSIIIKHKYIYVYFTMWFLSRQHSYYNRTVYIEFHDYN